MGCHTWFYKKIEVTEDQVREDVTKYLKREIDFYDRLVNNRDGIDKDLLETYPEWTKEYGLYHKPIYERRLRIIEKGLCKLAMYYKYKSTKLGGVYHFDKHTCTMYVSTDSLPHDTFRRGGYPEDKLLSLEDTLKYLEDNDDIIYYTSTIFDKTDRNILKDKSIERLKKFWNEYPEGMIDFG
jgi:hypothetical protein